MEKSTMNKVVGILKLAWTNCTPAVAQRTQALKISEVHPIFWRVNFALLKGKKTPLDLQVFSRVRKTINAIS